MGEKSNFLTNDYLYRNFAFENDNKQLYGK